jgi:uncharacterized protein (TIGR03067 family)
MNPIAILCIVVAVAAPLPKERPKSTESIIGEWVRKESTFKGQKLRDDPPEGVVRFVFAGGGTYDFFRGSEREIEGNGYKTDPKADPPTIDLEFPWTAVHDVVPGIYRVDGDTLTICLTVDHKPRSTRFASTAEAGTALWVFQRVKKE